jgi:hypothetical protein
MNRQGAIVKEKSWKLNATSAVFAAILAASAAGYAHAADMPIKAPPPAKPIPFFIVNDTSVSFTYFPTATNPGVKGSAGSVPGGVFGQRNTLARYSGEIDHFDVWEYGTNLIHLEANQYGPQDPNGGIPGTVGQREMFSFARSTIGFNEVTHSKMFSSPLFTDIGLEVGGNFGINDDFLASDTTVGVVGLSFNLNLPGSVIVSILADKEFSHSSFASCGNAGFGVASPGAGIGFGPCSAPFAGSNFSGDRDFEWTWKVETAIAEPLKFLPDSIPLTFINIASVEGPKGTGISPTNLIALGPTAAGGPGPATMANQLADTETKVEVFENARLSLDTSKVFWGKPGIWDTYIGYQYWYNKFGTDHNAILFAQGAPGTSVESSFYVGSTYHFK